MHRLVFFIFCITTSSIFLDAQIIGEDLVEAIASNETKTQEVLIMLKEKASFGDLSSRSRSHKRKEIVKRLKDNAEISQKSILNILNNLQKKGLVIEYQSLWINNSIRAILLPSSLDRISKIPNVSHINIYPQPTYLSDIDNVPPTSYTPGTSLPNHKAIKAHKLWEMGYTGDGIKILILDLLMDETHPAFSSNWLGNNVPWQHAWHTNNPNNSPFNSTNVHHEHGQTVAGIAVGHDPLTQDTVGVAFESEWMWAESFFSSFEWALDPDGNTNTTNDIPDVINCSFYMGHKTDCNTGTNNSSWNYGMQEILELLELADVVVVWAAGNSGPNQQSIPWPQNLNFSEVNPFSVGMIYHTKLLDGDNWPLHAGSSLGPTQCGGSGSLAIKPEVVAPSPMVYTAAVNGYTVVGNGTSFAAPHVSGAAALLMEAFPSATAVEVKQALYRMAKDLGTGGEDNSYGMGVIDVYAAYQYLDLNLSCANIYKEVSNDQYFFSEIHDAARILAHSTIHSQAIVSLKAAMTISLEQGFRAKTGSTFRASIDNCSVNFSDGDEQIFSSVREATKDKNILPQSIDVFPLPAENRVSIRVNNVKEHDTYSLLIINASGQVIYYQEEEEQKEKNIDVSSWDSGVYFGRTQTSDNKVRKFKILVQDKR